MFGILKKIFGFAGSRRKLLIKAMAVAFMGAVFASMQFGALMLSLDMILGQRNTALPPVVGIMLVSILGRMACFYYSTNGETETGYFMVAERRVHIGDRLRYIPMGYFNKNSLGNITAVVTTTLGDVENKAARCLVMVIGGFLNTVALCLVLTSRDWRLGCFPLRYWCMCWLLNFRSGRIRDRPSPAAGPGKSGGGGAGIYSGYGRGESLRLEKG